MYNRIMLNKFGCFKYKKHILMKTNGQLADLKKRLIKEVRLHCKKDGIFLYSIFV